MRPQTVCWPSTVQESGKLIWIVYTGGTGEYTYMPGRIIPREKKEEYLKDQTERESKAAPVTPRPVKVVEKWVKEKEGETQAEKGNVTLARKKLAKLFGE